MSQPMFMAADLGATNFRAGIFQRERGGFKQLCLEKFRCANYPSLQAMVTEFLGKHPYQVEYGCIGVPGPVADGRVAITNLPWEFSERQIEAETGLRRLHLVNDLVATAASLPRLKESQLSVVLPGSPGSDRQVRVVVAPGTGLGMGFLVAGAESVVLPSEGGHARFAPSDSQEIKLLQFLMEREPASYVSLESLLCGSGIKNIYDFVRHEYSDLVTDIKRSELDNAMAGAADPAALITGRALNREDQACVRTMEIFVSVLASHCGNVAVTNLAFGGVYLGGGIPPRIGPLLRTPVFSEKFLERGKMNAVVKKVPVFLIEDDSAALTGAASIASEDFERSQTAHTSKR